MEHTPNGITLGEFVDLDSSLECHSLLTDEEICSSACQPESELQSQSDDEGEEGDDGVTTPDRMPKPGEVLQAMGFFWS